MKHGLALWFLMLPFSVHAALVLSFDEVAPGIFMHQGKIADLFTVDSDPVANITFIVGNEAVAVVDTGGSKRAGEGILRAIRQRTDLPVRYVINTHVHPDHHFGNVAFVGEKPEFIAHARYPGDFNAKSGYYLQRLTKPWFDGTEPIGATRVVSEVTELDLGNRMLTLTPHERAHTRHDLSVFDQTSSTLIAGDLLFVDHLPTLDGSLKGWLAETKRLEAMPFKQVIPGHGPIQQSHHAFDRQTRYLFSLAQAVRAAISNHIDINTASTTVMPSPGDWKLYATFHPRNVIQAYKELEWE